MKAAALPVAALLIVGVSAGAATEPRPRKEWVSWADPLHGWAPNHNDWDCPRSLAVRYANSYVCATEDGGKSWRGIFNGGNYSQALRTSVSAGIVTTGAHGHGQYWTGDNGRHWYPTEVVGGPSEFGDPPPTFVGKRSLLFWSGFRDDAVYRVEPWPPREPAACTGPWSNSISLEDVSRSGNICLGRPVDAGMRSVPVVRFAGLLAVLRGIPGGFAAVVYREAQAGVTVYIHRGGTTLARDLPVPAGLHGIPSLRRLSIAWPSLTLYALVYPSGIVGEGETVEVRYRSSDGGSTWTVEAEPGWARGRDLPDPRAAAAAAVLNGEIVLVGGRWSSNSGGYVEHSFASTRVDAFAPAGSSQRLPGLPRAVAYAAAAAQGGRLYVVGGFGRPGAPLRAAWLLAEGRWQRLPDPPDARAAAGAAVIGNKLYVVGGFAASGLARRMLVLNLDRHTWSTVPGPAPRAYLGVAAAAGRLVAIGGRTREPVGTGVRLVESWRPGEAAWQPLARLPGRARSEGAAVAAGSEITVIGGVDDNYGAPIPAVFALDVSSDRWRRRPDLLTPRHSLSAAVLGGRVYTLAGGDESKDDRGMVNESLQLR